MKLVQDTFEVRRLLEAQAAACAADRHDAANPLKRLRQLAPIPAGIGPEAEAAQEQENAQFPPGRRPGRGQRGPVRSGPELPGPGRPLHGPWVPRAGGASADHGRAPGGRRGHLEARPRGGGSGPMARHLGECRPSSCGPCSAASGTTSRSSRAALFVSRFASLAPRPLGPSLDSEAIHEPRASSASPSWRRAPFSPGARRSRRGLTIETLARRQAPVAGRLVAGRRVASRSSGTGRASRTSMSWGRPRGRRALTLHEAGLVDGLFWSPDAARLLRARRRPVAVPGGRRRRRGGRVDDAGRRGE